jgi:hypothetical protein
VPARGKPPTAPPPIPVAAAAGASGRTRLPLPPDVAPPAPPRVTLPPVERTPPVIVDDSLTIPEAVPPVAPKLAVPVGEFDSGVQTLDDDKLRVAYHQATIKRDAASALLQIPEAPQTVVKAPATEVILGETAAALRGDPTAVRGDPTAIDSATSPFARGDATEIAGPSAAAHASGGTVRRSAQLRRKRGMVGDVYYVYTALAGVRRTRRELATLEQRQEVRQTSRRRHLVTLGRTAVTADGYDHPAVGKAREQLHAVEDERGKHVGAVAAADAELERVRRDRDEHAKQYVTDLAALEAELAELGKKLEPLEKEAAAVRKRAGELRDSIARIDRQIVETEAKLVSVNIDKLDKSSIQAEIATLKADRLAVARDEPVIAAELDALQPRIAALESARAEARKKKTACEAAEAEDQRRTSELLEAIGAKRKVVDRAASEAEAARDKALFELGERLYVDRPANLAAQLSPIDQIDLELGESDRRIMELREILSNVDRGKLARGIAVVLVALAAAGAFVAWVIVQLA